jgi:hypothetical protein
MKMLDHGRQRGLKGHGFSRANGQVKAASALAAEGCICRLNPIPQGLKASHFLATFYGTAEAVPFQGNFL